MKITVVTPGGEEKVLEGKKGWSIMEVIRDAGIEMLAECGGGCACATCHIQVDADWAAKLPAAEEEEVELVEESDTYDAATSRLCCQVECTEAIDGLRLTIQPDAFDG